MGVRPGNVCTLVKGKLIDVQHFFVDTFNWIVSFVVNLKGSEYVIVDRGVSDHPVIKLDFEKLQEDLEAEVTVTGTDGSSASGKSVVFASGSYSNVRAVVSQYDTDTVKVTLDVYYV